MGALFVYMTDVPKGLKQIVVVKHENEPALFIYLQHDGTLTINSANEKLFKIDEEKYSYQKNELKYFEEIESIYITGRFPQISLIKKK